MTDREIMRQALEALVGNQQTKHWRKRNLPASGDRWCNGRPAREAGAAGAGVSEVLHIPKVPDNGWMRWSLRSPEHRPTAAPVAGADG